jgi:F0F1-type ATP synthase assembly protein I
MKKDLKDNQQAANSYLKYSGIGFQLAATIGAGVFIGYKLDKWLKTPSPYFTVAFSLVFLVAALYSVFKSLLNDR